MVKSYEENGIYFWPNGKPAVSDGFYWEHLGASNFAYKRIPSHTVQDLRTVETLRDENKELRRRIERQRNDNNFLSAENGELEQAVEKLEKINKELQGSLNAYARDAVETEKCQNEPKAELTWAEADKLHKRRMAAETESIELDNLLKRAEYNGYKDYPKFVWERLDSRTRDLLHSIKNRTTVIWIAFAAFAVNEVIQWLTR